MFVAAIGSDGELIGGDLGVGQRPRLEISVDSVGKKVGIAVLDFDPLIANLKISYEDSQPEDMSVKEPPARLAIVKVGDLRVKHLGTVPQVRTEIREMLGVVTVTPTLLLVAQPAGQTLTREPSHLHQDRSQQSASGPTNAEDHPDRQ